MALVLTISGVVRKPHEGTLRVLAGLSGRSTLTCVIDSPDASYRPPLDAVVVLTDGALTPFAGTIVDPKESAILLGHDGLRTQIEAVSYTAIADRRVVFARFQATVAVGTIRLDAATLRPIGTTALHMDGATIYPLVGETFLIAGDPVSQTVVAVKTSTPPDGDFDVRFTPGTSVAIPATDGNQLVTFKVGWTTREIVTHIVNNYLAEFGVTLGAGMSDGILHGTVIYSGKRVSDVLTELANIADYTLNGWLWRIDEGKVLRFTVPGLVPAPFAITVPQQIVGDIERTTDRHDYANNVLVRVGGDAPRDVFNEKHLGNGVTRVFPLAYEQVTVTSWATEGGVARGLSLVRGTSVVPYAVGIFGIDSMPWTYDWFRHALIQDAAEVVLSATDLIDVSYQATGFVLRLTTSDAEALARGTWEIVIDAADTFDAVVARAIGTAELHKHDRASRRVSFTTVTHGLIPGQSITINLPTRAINNTYLITDVELSEATNKPRYKVTASEGAVISADWRDTFRLWAAGSSGGGSSGGAGGGGTVVISGGGGSGGGRTYPLGGASFGGVSSPTPTWVPSLGNAVQINAADIGGTTVVFASLRAPGTTVQARLFNRSLGVALASSSVVTGAGWTLVSWAVALSTGTHIYDLELLPGTANADVFCGGAYVETGR